MSLASVLRIERVWSLTKPKEVAVEPPKPRYKVVKQGEMYEVVQMLGIMFIREGIKDKTIEEQKGLDQIAVLQRRIIDSRENGKKSAKIAT